MRAGERGFVALVHGVRLVVPGFARAVLHSERQRQGQWRWCISHGDVWIGPRCSVCDWRSLRSCCACLFSRLKSKMRVGRGERRMGVPITSLSHVCRDGRIGTGVGKPLVGLPPAFGLGRNIYELTCKLDYGTTPALGYFAKEPGRL